MNRPGSIDTHNARYIPYAEFDLTLSTLTVPELGLGIDLVKLAGEDSDFDAVDQAEINRFEEEQAWVRNHPLHSIGNTYVPGSEYSDYIGAPEVQYALAAEALLNQARLAREYGAPEAGNLERQAQSAIRASNYLWWPEERQDRHQAQARTEVQTPPLSRVDGGVPVTLVVDGIRRYMYRDGTIDSRSVVTESSGFADLLEDVLTSPEALHRAFSETGRLNLPKPLFNTNESDEMVVPSSESEQKAA